MQLTEKLVYCIVCRQLVSRERSQWVFKTGFYKREYPLAQCGDCAQRLGQDPVKASKQE